MKHSLGRYVYGFAAIGSGIRALVWNNYDVLGDVYHRGAGSRFSEDQVLEIIVRAATGRTVRQLEAWKPGIDKTS